MTRRRAATTGTVRLAMEHLTSNTRPRGTYILPDGTRVAVIFDHGEHQPASVSFTLAGGRIVLALRA